MSGSSSGAFPRPLLLAAACLPSTLLLAAAALGCGGGFQATSAIHAEALRRRAQQRAEALRSIPAPLSPEDARLRDVALQATREASEAALRHEPERARAALAHAEAAEALLRARATARHLDAWTDRLQRALDAAIARSEALADSPPLHDGEPTAKTAPLEPSNSAGPRAPDEAVEDALGRAKEAERWARRASTAPQRRDLRAAERLWRRVARIRERIRRRRLRRQILERRLEDAAAKAGRRLRRIAEEREARGRAEAARIALQEAERASRLAMEPRSASPAEAAEATRVLIERAELCLLLATRGGAPETAWKRVAELVRRAQDAPPDARLRAADEAHLAASALLAETRRASTQPPSMLEAYRHARALGLEAERTERGLEVRWPPRSLRGAALRRFATRLATWLRVLGRGSLLVWLGHPRATRARATLRRMAEALRAAGVEHVALHAARSPRRPRGPFVIWLQEAEPPAPQ